MQVAAKDIFLALVRMDVATATASGSAQVSIFNYISCNCKSGELLNDDDDDNDIG